MCMNFTRKVDAKEIEDLFNSLDAGDLPREFTAYDVTQALRKEVGPHIEVDHKDVRKIIHNLLDNNIDYLKNNHPQFGATTYRRLIVSTQTPVMPVVPTPLTSSKVGKMVPTTHKTYRGDCRGTVTVPLEITRQISCNVFKVVDGDNPKTKKLLPSTGKIAKGTKGYYRKDSHGNVRVTKANLPTSATGLYIIELNKQGEIEIKGV
jgi:hypothetical protein